VKGEGGRGGRGRSGDFHKHASQSHCKMGAQGSYLILGVDTGLGAAVQEELHGLYARTIYRGVHQHSRSTLHEEGREGEIVLGADR
jgi:hypothetical protein